MGPARAPRRARSGGSREAGIVDTPKTGARHSAGHPLSSFGAHRDQDFDGGFEGVYCSLGSLLVRSQPASPSQYGLMSCHTFGKVIE